MITISTTDVFKYAPELASTTSGVAQVYLGLALNFVNEQKWGRKYVQAVCLMTAHLLTLQIRKSSAGAITSESVGELSVSYSTPSTGDEELKSTIYGAAYFMLRKTLSFSPVVL